MPKADITAERFLPTDRPRKAWVAPLWMIIVAVVLAPYGSSALIFAAAAFAFGWAALATVSLFLGRVLGRTAPGFRAFVPVAANLVAIAGAIAFIGLTLELAIAMATNSSGIFAAAFGWLFEHSDHHRLAQYAAVVWLVPSYLIANRRRLFGGGLSCVLDGLAVLSLAVVPSVFLWSPHRQ